jgi:hypothetical protein
MIHRGLAARLDKLEAKKPSNPPMIIWNDGRSDLSERIAEAKRAGRRPIIVRWLPATAR